MNTKIIFILIFVLIFVSCKKENKKINTVAVTNTVSLKNVKHTEDTTTCIDTTKQKDTVTQNIKQNTIKKENKCQILKNYKILLPSEIFYKSQKLQAHFERIYPINVEKINTSTQQALALGVVSADLIYASYFRNKTYVDKLYLSAMKLSEKLGIQKIIDKDGVEKLQNETNFDIIDTFVINKITNLCNELSKETTTLGFVIFGAWVESNYLLTDLIKHNSQISDSLYLKLYQQKEIPSSMIKFYNNILPDISDYNISLNVQTLLDELKAFEQLYNNVFSNNSYQIDQNNLNKLDSAFVVTRKNLFVNPQKKIEMSMRRPNQP